MKEEKQVRIHRFGNRIAIDSDSMTETIYLDAQIANSLAHAMLSCCGDIEVNTFSKSQFIDRIIGHFEGK